MSWRKRTAEERDALRHGLSIRTEAELDAALYEESLESQYGDPSVHPGKGWEPSKLVRSFHPGRDGLPTIDDDPSVDPHVFPRVYPAWKDGETFVVSGPCGDYSNTDGGGRLALIKQRGFGKRNNALNPDPSAGLRTTGRFFKSRHQARRWALEKYGAILEEYMMKRRWCLRVPVPGGPHDPRTKTA